MSFFVSKSIEDIIDSECVEKTVLGKQPENDSFFGIKCTSCDNEVVKIPLSQLNVVTNNTINVLVKSNLNLLQQLFFKKVKVDEIIIGKESLAIDNSLLIAVKDVSKTYEISMTLYLEEDINV